MYESRYWFLTGRYLSQNLTDDEKFELRDYIERNTISQEQFELHVKLWKSFTPEQKEVDFDTRNSWLELKARISEQEKQKWLKPIPITWWRGVAAACTIALIATLLFLWVNHQSTSIIVTTAENKERFILPDSTTVWLNRNSRLTYTSAFDGDERQVQLMGEAYFEVRHNPSKPFIVKSNQTYTRVLGTKFNVTSYDSDNAIMVSVVQGKVQFGNTISEVSSLILTKDCIGIYRKDIGEFVKTISDDPNLLSWQTNKLVFDNSPLHYVVRQIERCYNIKVYLNTSGTVNCPFSGTFNNQPLEEVINIIELTMNVNFLKNTDSSYSVAGHACSL